MALDITRVNAYISKYFNNIINHMSYLTHMIREDGFGAQFQSVLWAFLYTELTGNLYVYTDIENMDHITKTGSIKDTEIENTLDEIIDYMAFNKFRRNDTDITGEIRTLDVSEPYDYVQQNMYHVFKSSLFQQYKEFFYRDKKNRYNKEYINVAIHIRRLSTFDRENNLFEFRRHGVTNKDYLDKINLIRNKYINKKLIFHIYSQGGISNFQEFISEDIVLHLNEKVLDTFTDLIFADILVTCRSSFSYVAALLSNNEVYYLPFWHPPLNHWNILN